MVLNPAYCRNTVIQYEEGQNGEISVDNKLLVFSDSIGSLLTDNAGNAVEANQNNIEIDVDTTIAGSPYVDVVFFDSTTSTNNISGEPQADYHFTGTAGGTLTLSDVTKEHITDATAWRFVIKDEGGNCTASPLTIAPESGLIDGAASIQILVDNGSVMLSCDGDDFWSI